LNTLVFVLIAFGILAHKLLVFRAIKRECKKNERALHFYADYFITTVMLQISDQLRCSNVGTRTEYQLEYSPAPLTGAKIGFKKFGTVRWVERYNFKVSPHAKLTHPSNEYYPGSFMAHIWIGAGGAYSISSLVAVIELRAQDNPNPTEYTPPLGVIEIDTIDEGIQQIANSFFNLLKKLNQVERRREEE
jgi:hypothetical protein